MYFESEISGANYKIEVLESKSNWKVSIQKENGNWNHYDISKNDYKRSESYYSFLWKGVCYLVDVIGKDTEYTVFTRNSFRTVKIFNEEMLLHTSLKRGGGLGAERELKSGMPGKIIEIFVKPGDVVTQNSPLLIMEAMKMENEMRATSDVKISEICVKQGDSVDTGAVLIKFEKN